MKRAFIIPNRYVDSVTLMGVAIELPAIEGVNDAECGMGTKQNQELLRMEGYAVPEGVGKNDLMIAIDGQTDAVLEQAKDAALKALSTTRGKHKRVYHDVDELEPGKYDVLQISLPGKYAIREAEKAIDKGMDVFIFSADIELEDERRIKEYGYDHGCLVMGPDAGVGLLGGVAMAAGSIVRYGPVGVIGASGSGSQEVACLIEEMGSGVTCILGTGGRDLKKAVGGVSMKADMKRLDKDENTKLICLVSMLADREVMEEVLCEADQLSKPVVAVFLGADESLYRGHCVTGTYDLLSAAKACVRAITGAEPKLGWSEAETALLARDAVAKLSADKKYFRGLYTGGTFAEETLMTFRAVAAKIELHTNRENTQYAVRLKTYKHSERHTLLDMGDLDFTAEAPHTVFDPTQRLRRFKQELEDSSVGLIARDIILGPGVARDPASCYLPLMQARQDVVYVCTVCGGEGDPQNKREIKRKLQQAGAIVADSNFDSARLCAKICQEWERN
ncbi:MAG: hypothetical protein RSB91_05710 [Clostridia bacterium]